MYLRDRNYQPVGCVAIKLVKVTGMGGRHYNTLIYGVSVLNPQDQFNRAVARQLALGRIVEVPSTTVIPGNSSIHDISEAVMRSITRSTVLPNRARQAAKLWLKNNGFLSHDDKLPSYEHYGF